MTLQQPITSTLPMPSRPQRSLVRQRLGPAASTKTVDGDSYRKILVIDDEEAVRDLCCSLLQEQGYACVQAADGVGGLERAHQEPFDLILLDIDMPRMTGMEVLKQLRREPFPPSLKVFMFSGRATADELAETLALGADDYVEKPFSSVQFLGRVKAALRLKDSQDRSEALNTRLSAINRRLEINLCIHEQGSLASRNALVVALTELVANRDNETGAHLLRVQRYTQCLAKQAAKLPDFADQIDKAFFQLLECCAPLHDIGKVAVPDYILLKPARLDHDERRIMQTHTVIGSEILQKVAASHQTHQNFFQMAIEITRHHHERFDGKGYPDQLAGNAIPLAARILAIADVYDGLRSHRPYKPAMSHAQVVEWMIQEFDSHFDNQLLQAFRESACQFEEIFRALPA